jgi:hypothetical protein
MQNLGVFSHYPVCFFVFRSPQKRNANRMVPSQSSSDSRRSTATAIVASNPDDVFLKLGGFFADSCAAAV